MKKKKIINLTRGTLESATVDKRKSTTFKSDHSFKSHGYNFFCIIKTIPSSNCGCNLRTNIKISLYKGITGAADANYSPLTNIAHHRIP